MELTNVQLKFSRKLKSLDDADFLISEPWPSQNGGVSNLTVLACATI